jgi:hypothetical protein
MLVANGKRWRIELEGETIRFVPTTWGPGKGDLHEIKVSCVVDVRWQDPGLFHGIIRFVVPGGKLSESFVGFGRNSRDEFRAFYDAVVGSIHDARRLGAHLSAVFKPGFTIPLTTPETPAVVVRRNLRLGEIRREFDSQTAGVIQGTMRHELGLHGSFTGVRLGQIGIGRGQLGLSGMTSVDLQTNSTTRSDFQNDGFVAIFDEPSQTAIPETLRVIVPSEEACREVIVDYLSSVCTQMGLDRFDPGLGQRITPVAARSIATDISYVSDKLGAVLRMNAEKAPVFNVVGVMSGPHMMLGGAIQMPGDDRWLQLFPVHLLRILSMPPGDGGRPEQPMLPR